MESEGIWLFLANRLSHVSGVCTPPHEVVRRRAGITVSRVTVIAKRIPRLCTATSGVLPLRFRGQHESRPVEKTVSGREVIPGDLFHGALIVARETGRVRAHDRFVLSLGHLVLCDQERIECDLVNGAFKAGAKGFCVRTPHVEGTAWNQHEYDPGLVVGVLGITLGVQVDEGESRPFWRWRFGRVTGTDPFAVLYLGDFTVGAGEARKSRCFFENLDSGCKIVNLHLKTAVVLSEAHFGR